MSKELMNINQLMREFDTTFRVVEVALEKAGIEPVFTHMLGKRKMRMFDPEVARPTIEAYMKASVRQQKKVEAEPVPLLSELVDSNPVLQRMDTALHELMTFVETQDEVIGKTFATLLAQGPALLKAIEKVHLDLSAKIAALQETIDSMQPPAAEPAPPPASTVVPLPAPSAVAPKRKVTIIGLFDSHAAIIDREFKDAFDLRIYNIDEAKGQGVMARMQASEVVFIMTKFVNHTVENLAKAAGVKVQRVTGGMSQIRDRLTELFCKEAA